MNKTFGQFTNTSELIDPTSDATISGGLSVGSNLSIAADKKIVLGDKDLSSVIKEDGGKDLLSGQTFDLESGDGMLKALSAVISALGGTFATATAMLMACFSLNAAEPGTADSFKDYSMRSPIVTNAVQAFNAAFDSAVAPTGTLAKAVADEDGLTIAKLVLEAQKTSCVTNDASGLKDIDQIIVEFNENKRSGSIYLGPEYTNMLQNTASKAIMIKPDGVIFNGSTNNVYVTNMPAVIRFTQLLGTNVWLKVEYAD